jgi:hypothetical protein
LQSWNWWFYTWDTYYLPNLHTYTKLKLSKICLFKFHNNMYKMVRNMYKSKNTCTYITCIENGHYQPCNIKLLISYFWLYQNFLVTNHINAWGMNLDTSTATNVAKVYAPMFQPLFSKVYITRRSLQWCTRTREEPYVTSTRVL